MTNAIPERHLQNYETMIGLVPDLIDLDEHDKDEMVGIALASMSEETRICLIEKLFNDSSLLNFYQKSAVEPMAALNEFKNDIYAALEHEIQLCIDNYNESQGD